MDCLGCCDSDAVDGAAALQWLLSPEPRVVVAVLASPAALFL